MPKAIDVSQTGARFGVASMQAHARKDDHDYVTSSTAAKGKFSGSG
jgi:hypothetical protein